MNRSRLQFSACLSQRLAGSHAPLRQDNPKGLVITVAYESRSPWHDSGELRLLVQPDSDSA